MKDKGLVNSHCNIAKKMLRLKSSSPSNLTTGVLCLFRGDQKSKLYGNVFSFREEKAK